MYLSHTEDIKLFPCNLNSQGECSYECVPGPLSHKSLFDIQKPWVSNRVPVGPKANSWKPNVHLGFWDLLARELLA